MGGSTFTAGQRVNVEFDGRQIECIFVRDGARHRATDVKGGAGLAGETASEFAWVRRSDTGEVEPVDYRLISTV
jgi:hypothetical protein